MNVPASATEQPEISDEELEGLYAEAEQELEATEVWDAPSEVERESVGDAPDGVWGEEPAEEESQLFQRLAEEAPASDLDAEDYLGVLPYYPLHPIEVFSNTTAAVNLATGNLVVGSTQVELSSAGVPAVYTDHYNSLDTTPGSLGGGWRSGIGQDTGLRFTDDEETELRFRDASGFNQYFELDADGEWVSPAGLNATLVETDEGYQIDYHRTGQRLQFSSGGYLLESTDRNDVGVEFAYDEEDRVSSVTDPAGRVTRVNYDDSGDTITYVLPDGQREVVYSKNDDGQLGTVEYTGANSGGTTLVQRTHYFYDGEDRLSAIQAQYGNTGSRNTLFITYDDQNRVESLTQDDRLGAIDDGANPGNQFQRTTSFDYSSDETVVTDRAGEESTFSIDDQGRVTEAIDQLGRERSQEWSANSDVISSTSGASAGGPAGDITIYEYGAPVLRAHHGEVHPTRPLRGGEQSIHLRWWKPDK